MSPRKQRTVGKVVKTSAVIGGGSAFWSNKERESLLSALKKHGTTDLQKLADEVGTRTVGAVKVFLERRGKELRQEAEKAKSEGTNAYLGHWAQLMHRAKESKYRSTDRAQILTEIVDECAEGDFPEPTHDEEPNFRELYRYLADVMRDQVPAGLSDTDSWVLKHLLTSVSDVMMMMDLRPEKSALDRALVQIESAAAYSGTMRDTDDVMAQSSEDLPDIETLQVVQGVSRGSSTLADNDPSCSSQSYRRQPQFPPWGRRIRIINATWNPLQIPPEVLRQEHQAITSILYGSEQSGHEKT